MPEVSIPTVVLNNATKIPVLGLASWGWSVSLLEIYSDIVYNLTWTVNKRIEKDLWFFVVNLCFFKRNSLSDFIIQESAPESIAQSTKDAIDLGYRFFDTTPGKNEEEIGLAVYDKMKEGVVKR